MLEKSLGHGSGDSTSCAALFFIFFFPKQTVPQRLAKLLLLDLEEKKRRESESDVGCSTLQGKDNAILDV